MFSSAQTSPFPACFYGPSCSKEPTLQQSRKSISIYFKSRFLQERKKFLFLFWVAGKMESGSQDLFAAPPKSCSNNTNWAKYTFRFKPVQTQRFEVFVDSAKHDKKNIFPIKRKVLSCADAGFLHFCPAFVCIVKINLYQVVCLAKVANY